MQGPSLAAYGEVLSDRNFYDSLALTLYVAGVSTAVSTVLAVLAALALRRAGGTLSTVVFQLPITVSQLVAAVGIALVVSQTGLGARFAASAGLIGEQPSESPALLYDRYSAGRSPAPWNPAACTCKPRSHPILRSPRATP